MFQRLFKLENPTTFMSVCLSLLCLPACLHGVCMHALLPFGQKYFSSHLIRRHIRILYLVIFVNMLLDICIRYYWWNSFWIPVKEVLFFSSRLFLIHTMLWPEKHLISQIHAWMLTFVSHRILCLELALY